MTITLDIETKSYADLKKVGAWAYSEHPSTDVICICWQSETGGPIESWWPGHPNGNTTPESLTAALIVGEPIEVHNVAFEYSIWHNVLAPRYGWPVPALEQWRDTMATACYFAMPPALDKLLHALGQEGKNTDGTRLITKYSKLYLKTAKTVISLIDFERWLAYCADDVRKERWVGDYLGELPPLALREFHASFAAGARGLRLDLASIEAVEAIVAQRSAELTGEFRALTGVNPTQRDRVLEWFKARGAPFDDTKADTLEEWLEEGDTSDEALARAVEIKVQVNKASTKKLSAMASNRGKDGRARFQTRWHGAVTGRPTGTGFQPLNLSRGFQAMNGWEDLDPEQLIQDIGYRDARYLGALYGDVIDAVGKASRHFIEAEDDCILRSCDFASIEAVVLACGAGEEWKIDVFRRKEDVYCATASRILGRPIDKKKNPVERQRYGKIPELLFGYGGSIGAVKRRDSMPGAADDEIKALVKDWRGQHPATTRLWREYEAAAVEAVMRPGAVTSYRQAGFELVDDWLSMILPDETRIWYFHPEIRVQMPPWHQPSTDEACRFGLCTCEPRPSLTYMAWKFGQWKRVHTYGGKLAENWTQATSARILEPAKTRIIAAGYPVILDVYDEIVTETPDGFGSKIEFERIMGECPGEWARGWPIRAEAWEGSRYRK